MELGRSSTILISLFLLAGVMVIGFAIQSPSLLAAMVGAPLWAKAGVFILAFLVLLFDYANPRIKDIVANGGDFHMTQGALSTFVMGLVTIAVYIVATNPTAILPLLGNAGASYGTMIAGIAAIGWNVLKPRYGEFITETPKLDPPVAPAADEPVVTPEEDDTA